ncbi:MAG: hypothetical protein HYS80_02500, partial [Candidatus Aenigmarchaeota archaeon]|nr:hypothetical protein [Candidatus Aenigmarchaeota archaeon]
MNKIIGFVLIILLSIVAVSAAPVTIQDGNLNLSKNLTIQGNEVDSIHIKTSSGSSIFRIDALNDVMYTGLLRPRSDASYDVGQSSNRYKNIYLSGNVSASNVCYSNGTNCIAGQDTNETVRFNALVNTDCSGTDKVTGVLPNGTVVCGSDLNSGSSKQGDGFYLTNDSTTIYFNESKLNQTIDARDSDTTYVNGTGISLSGTTFSIILSYFQGLFVELTDSFGGDVSGTYNALQVTDNSHNLHWDNVTSKPNLDTNASDDLNSSTAFGGDVSGTYNALLVTDNSHSLHWDNVSNKPANLDTDSTDDVTTSTSHSGDVSGAYNALLVADNSHSLHWDNVTSKPNLDTNASDDLNATTAFGGDVSGTYNNLQVADNSHSLNCGNVTGATSNLCTIVDTNTGNTSAQILAVIDPQGYYNASKLNTTSLENQAGSLGVKHSWITSAVSSSSVGGDLSGTVGAASVIDNSVLSHWDNVSNKPANLDTDSTNDLTTSASFGGDASGTYDNLQIKENSTTLSCSNVTGATSNLCTIVDTDTNTIWSIVSNWLFNNTGSLDFNETKLNLTIDARELVNTSEQMQDAAWNITFDNECIVVLYDDENNKTSLDINKTCLFQNEMNGLSSQG